MFQKVWKKWIWNTLNWYHVFFSIERSFCRIRWLSLSCPVSHQILQQISQALGRSCPPSQPNWLIMKCRTQKDRNVQWPRGFVRSFLPWSKTQRITTMRFCQFWAGLGHYLNSLIGKPFTAFQSLMNGYGNNTMTCESFKLLFRVVNSNVMKTWLETHK